LPGLFARHKLALRDYSRLILSSVDSIEDVFTAVDLWAPDDGDSDPVDVSRGRSSKRQRWLISHRDRTPASPRPASRLKRPWTWFCSWSRGRRHRTVENQSGRNKMP